MLHEGIMYHTRQDSSIEYTAELPKSHVHMADDHRCVVTCYK